MKRLPPLALSAAGAVAAAAASVAPGAAQELPFLEHARVDPRHVMTAEACGECHISEYEVWEKTPHAEGFKTLGLLKLNLQFSAFLFCFFALGNIDDKAS